MLSYLHQGGNEMKGSNGKKKEKKKPSDASCDSPTTWELPPVVPPVRQSAPGIVQPESRQFDGASTRIVGVGE